MPDNKNMKHDWDKAAKALAAAMTLGQATDSDREALAKSQAFLEGIADFARDEAEKAVEEALEAMKYPVPENARLIWSDMPPQCDPGIDQAIAKHPMADQDIIDAMLSDHPADWQSDEMVNLGDVKLDVMAIGDLGRWNGRRQGYKIIEGTTLAKAVLSDFRGRDHLEYTAYAENGEIRIKAVHHDATDYFTLQEITDMGALAEALDKNDADAVQKCLIPLYPRVAKIYGWPEETPAAHAWQG